QRLQRTAAYKHVDMRDAFSLVPWLHPGGCRDPQAAAIGVNWLNGKCIERLSPQESRRMSKQVFVLIQQIVRRHEMAFIRKNAELLQRPSFASTDANAA